MANGWFCVAAALVPVEGPTKALLSLTNVIKCWSVLTATGNSSRFSVTESTLPRSMQKSKLQSLQIQLLSLLLLPQRCIRLSTDAGCVSRLFFAFKLCGCPATCAAFTRQSSEQNMSQSIATNALTVSASCGPCFQCRMAIQCSLAVKVVTSQKSHPRCCYSSGVSSRNAKSPATKLWLRVLLA